MEPKTNHQASNSNYNYPGGLDYSSQLGNLDENPINWRRYIFLFMTNWYWFLITMGIGLGIAFFKVRYTIPKYEVSASLIIEEEENTEDVLGEFRSIRFRRRQADLVNEVAKLRSFSMIKRAVDSLDQDIFWTAHGRIRERPLYNNNAFHLHLENDSIHWAQGLEWFVYLIDTSSYRLYHGDLFDTIVRFGQHLDLNDFRFSITRNIYTPGNQSYSFVINNPVILTNYYRNKIKIESDYELGSIINLLSSGSVGEREVEFLNMLCKIYILSGLERKQQIAENTFIFIDDQIDVILDSLKEAETQLLTFRLSNNVINLSREGEIAFEKLKNYHEQLTELKVKDNYYRYLNKYIKDRNDPQAIIAPSLVNVTDQMLISSVQQLQVLYQDRENLNVSLLESNPEIESINERISSARLRILEIVEGLIDNNHFTINQIEIEQQSVIGQLKTLPINEQQLLNIKRKYDLYNHFYTFLLERRAEAGIKKASTISNARILDAARNDQIKQLGNNHMMILIIALFLALSIPALIIILADILDKRIKEREDITKKVNVPIIGIIGHSFKKEPLSLIKDFPSSSFSESLRRIRTNIQFILREDSEKVILVTSSVSGEGKTFTALNLAAIFALNKKKVLLMGCDLRRPSLHKLLRNDNKIGVTTCIIGDHTVDECIVETEIENLFFLPSGPVPPNPAELLETIQMNDIMVELNSRFDYIILDTPPVALVSDSLSLSKFAHLTIYVVRQNYSNKDVLEVVNGLQHEERFTNMVILINDIKASKSLGVYYYYGYTSSYNYGYYYKNQYYKDYYHD